MTLIMIDTTWFDRVPKAELHLHLEGAIPLDALWQLVQKYGGDPAVPDFAALQHKFTYRDFPQFIRAWCWKNTFLREYEDFTFIAEAVAHDLAQQNIRYAEAFYSPIDFAQYGLDAQHITEAICAGLSKEPNVEVALVADLVRDDGPQQGALTLAKVNEVRSLGVIGIGIGGSEHEFPPEPFAPVYEQARRMGFHTSAHAGEAAGPASIWGAIGALKAERIGHGTSAMQDAALVDYLATQRIPVEMCPISNVRTAAVPSIEQHPIRAFYERGVVVTVNTDDPKMFNNSLAEEYRLLHEKLGFSQDDLRTLILQAVQSSWLSAERKQAMIAAFKHDPAWMSQV
jgi:adenosine deaminase